MNQNKILSLEEIEQLEKGIGKYYMTVKADVAFDLLATARAYWELRAASKDIIDIDQSSVFGFGPPEDKPEAPVETVSYLPW